MHLRLALERERLARDALTFETWGTGLDRATYLERELLLRAHPWARRTLETWLWCSDDGTVYSSCEAFIDEARLGSQLGNAATIASVFTEASLRGQGHASRMLKALQAQLTGRCLAATLYSEVGTEFYRRLGFTPAPSFDTWFPPLAAAPEGVTWLTAPHADKSSVLLPQALQLTLSAERLDWHLEREKLYARALSRPALPHCGAQVGKGTINWTAYWKTNELQVLSLSGTDQELPLLVQAAQHAAARAGLPTVRIWETVPLSHLWGARREARTDEVAMFCPLVPKLQAWASVERGLWA